VPVLQLVALEVTGSRPAEWVARQPLDRLDLEATRQADLARACTGLVMAVLRLVCLAPSIRLALERVGPGPTARAVLSLVHRVLVVRVRLGPEWAVPAETSLAVRAQVVRVGLRRVGAGPMVLAGLRLVCRGRVARGLVEWAALEPTHRVCLGGVAT
jgi:hypothetical protein